MSKSYIGGRPAEPETHHHISSFGTYFKILVALLVLTVVTVGVSFADLGVLSFPVAMFVACIKAGLVIGYFMHLKYDTPMHSFVFFGALLFVFFFFFFTFADINTRDMIQQEWGNRAYFEDNFQGFPDPPAGHGQDAAH